MPSPLIEVYLEIGKVQDSTEKILLCRVPETFGNEDPSEANILKRLQEFSFSAPNPVVKDSENRRFAAVQYTYVLQECVNIKSADCDITTLNHYVFCLQREDGMTTHCISSLYPYFRSFYKLLSVISTASKEGKEASIEKLLLAIAKETRLPTPGNPVTVHLPPSYGIPSVSIEHESPFCLPLMYENDHIAEFYRAFGLLQSFDQSVRRDASTLVRIFAHLLMERRFLVTSNEVRRFTSSCYALQTIIYPLQWEFTFVPLLFPDPRIIDMVGLPQPYIMGIHKSFLEDALKISDSPEDCAIVLDVDTGHISPHFADDVEILPKEVRVFLESRLSNSEMISRKGDYFCRIFMDALVLLIGDYSQFFIPNVATNSVEFSWQKYQAYRPDADYRRFALAAESKLGMIKMFILSRLDMVKQGRQIAFDDFERSLKDRALIVKECRGHAVQHRLRHGAGKVMGGIKKLGGALMPPRSHSRPILEYSSPVGSSYTLAVDKPAIRRPLSQEDISCPVEISQHYSAAGAVSAKTTKSEEDNGISVRSLAQTLPSSASVPPPASVSVQKDAFEFQQPAPLPTVTSKVVVVVEDLIHLGSSSEEGDSCDEEVDKTMISVRRSLPPEVLQKNDPLALFDPLESRSAVHGKPQSGQGQKSRSNSMHHQQQRELIDRVLALYTAVPPSSQPPQFQPSPVASFQPAFDIRSRQSILFPGRIPTVQFQHFHYSSAAVIPPYPNNNNNNNNSTATSSYHQQQPVNFFPPTSTFPPSSQFQMQQQQARSCATLPAKQQQVQVPPTLPPKPSPDMVADRLSKWTRFDD